MNHRKTPLRVPIMAILAAILAAFLFGGVSRADEDTVSSRGSVLRLVLLPKPSLSKPSRLVLLPQ